MYIFSLHFNILVWQFARNLVQRETEILVEQQDLKMLCNLFLVGKKRTKDTLSQTNKCYGTRSYEREVIAKQQRLPEKSRYVVGPVVREHH